MVVSDWWGLFCRENLYNSSLFYLPRVSGNSIDGIFFLPPPVLEITFHEGLWDKINEQTGLLFDLGEEEEIDPYNSTMIINNIQLLSKKYEKLDSIISRVVGKSNDENIIATIATSEFSNWLIKLAIYLKIEANNNNTVCAIF